MQLGLRFAAAKLPGLRTGQVVGNVVEPKRDAPVARSAGRGLGVCYGHPADPLYNKEKAA